MNNILKKLVVSFTLLCVIVLVVFAFQLFVQNRPAKDEPGEPSPSQSASRAPETPGGADTETPQASGGGEPSETTSGPGDDDAAPAVPTGKRYALTMPGGAELILHADEDLFSHSEQEMGDMLTYRGAGAASIEISLVGVPQGADKLATGFLENYIDFTGGRHSYEGPTPVGRSKIIGEYVSASKNSETYDAWIIEFEDDEELAGLGFAVVINYTDETQRAAIYKVLDSMEMV